MLSFGEALKVVRGRRDVTALEVAVAALPNGTEERQRDFANYLSKIEKDRVPNVGLVRLRLVATGLKFPSLTAFFAELEAVQNDTKVATVPLTTHQRQTHNAPLSSGGGDDGVARVLSATDRRILTIVSDALADAALAIRYHRDAPTSDRLPLPRTSSQESHRRKRGGGDR